MAFACLPIAFLHRGWGEGRHGEGYVFRQGAEETRAGMPKANLKTTRRGRVSAGIDGTYISSRVLQAHTRTAAGDARAGRGAQQSTIEKSIEGGGVSLVEQDSRALDDHNGLPTVDPA